MTESKLTNNSFSIPTSKSKASIQKGAKFEDNVADVFRLLGANVIQNIEICQKKVDIFATFRLPGSSTGHRIIVECKDEKKAVNQNQRVMQFKGLLETARKSGEADSAEIITNVPWSDQAKGFARESGIALLTFTEKIGQLIDFSMYLKDIIDRFEKGDTRRQGEPPLGTYYVDLSAERITKKGTDRISERISVLDDYIHQWMQHDDTQHLAILGEYGAGKSSWCQKLAHDLAASYLKAPGSVRIPILFNLREFTKTLKIESLVTSFLDEECGVLNPRFKLFQVMNDTGIFLIIFDGFDEMAVKVDADTLEINLQEIEKLSTSPKSKVILTSRLEYFISGEEEKRSLSPRGELLATRQTEYEPLKIIPWDDEQVNSFLKKRVPLIKEAKQPWTYYRDCIKKISGLSDLSRRPVLLDMIVKTLPQLISSDRPINRPNLYETYLLGEIKRQKILKKRNLLLSDVSRFSLLQHLALDFHVNEISAITFTDALRHVEEVVKPPKSELEVFTRDFLTCSFLVREKDEYHFSHRSIMEYLIAKGLMEEIEKNAPNAFYRQNLQPVVAGFLIELNPNRDMLWHWIESTKSKEKEDFKYLGGNAATLLCMLDRNVFSGRNLSKAVLIGANLTLADLRGANLSETVIKDINLTSAQFFKKDLDSARVSNLIVSLCFFGNIGKEEDKVGTLIRQLALQYSFDPRNQAKESKYIIPYRASYSDFNLKESINPIIGILNVRVSDMESLQLFHSIIANQEWIIAVSLYAEEYEKFLARIPETLRYQSKEFLRNVELAPEIRIFSKKQ